MHTQLQSHTRSRSRWIFLAGLTGLLLFEIALVYFIMPFPGSQQLDSLGLAYFLHRSRHAFRVLFALAVIYGLSKAGWSRRWIPYVSLTVVLLLALLIQMRMSADRMFRQPKQLRMVAEKDNAVDPRRLVIGVVQNGEARAYPIRFLAYHHQVLDTLGGKPVMVTYCNVCRTGRVFEPMVDGKPDNFRLVGMDHFNAMFEDASTGSWWRQATGEAVAGPLKGKRLPEVFSEQTRLSAWIARYPQTLVMQEDPAFREKYDTTFLYEEGKSRKKLTGTDSLSWGRKSWVVGVKSGDQTRAYDWNTLLSKRLLEDTLGGIPVFIVVSADSGSFYAFRKPGTAANVRLHDDTLYVSGRTYRLDGKGIDTAASLSRLPSYQEFWHSWETFHSAGTRH